MTSEETQRIVEELVDARIAERLEQRCDFSQMTVENLRELIESFTPDRSFGAGKKFLLAILDANGRDGLQSFMNRMEDILILKRRSINPDRDLTREELGFYRASRATIDRRQLIKLGATYLGLGVGAGAMAIPAVEFLGDVSSNNGGLNSTRSPTEIAGQAVLAAVPMAGGVVTIARSLNEMNKIRLQQVLEAISELSIGAGPNPGTHDSALSSLPHTMSSPKGVIGRLLSGGRTGDKPDKPDGQTR